MPAVVHPPTHSRCCRVRPRITIYTSVHAFTQRAGSVGGFY